MSTAVQKETLKEEKPKSGKSKKTEKRDADFILNFGPDVSVNYGKDEIEKAKENNVKVVEPLRREYSFYGDLKSKLHIVLVKNYLDQEYADRVFEGLKRIRYNSDEESMIKIMGKKIKIPRKQTAFGDPGANYHFSGISVQARDWTQDDGTIDTEMGNELRQICRRVEKTAGRKFNYVLINNYLDQTNSIGYHSDDERELGEFPVIAGLSLGEEREIYFKSKINGKVVKISLPHNSLVVMHYPTNTYWEHCIPKVKSYLGQRISLTFRSVDERLKTKGVSK
ncbi:putative alpha-ketoglutarate-dependent dioxygenase alkB-like 2-like [Yasminevirus sp. GU-2018]|uniref:Putative alpha-ketoglutarate-dependent dioxygenase alkB-like 2-like n=1 Tax=Yasminevirus sp. GU-2018 TaxID=2420051 RepID=A0A5K0U808_9VIRU|nr:putative alpha-ketoglutarate-dependent dioxygenase alkB-like 2-like [Yasminevirus sp. GU-2018]